MTDAAENNDDVVYETEPKAQEPPEHKPRELTALQAQNFGIIVSKMKDLVLLFGDDPVGALSLSMSSLANEPGQEKVVVLNHQFTEGALDRLRDSLNRYNAQVEAQKTPS